MKPEGTRVTLVGAGLAGGLLAVLLARRGFRVSVFERRSDPRGLRVPAGRSINLALAERGRHALRVAGLLETVDGFTIPMRGRMLHDGQGRQTLQPYGKDEQEVIWSVHRAGLNRVLLDAAEATGRVQFRFDHSLSGIDWVEQRLRFERDDQAAVTEAFDVLIGADGSGSAVRAALSEVTDSGVHEERLDHGYLELGLPPAARGDWALDAHALHIWPRGGHMLIALPNADGSFTVTLFLAHTGEPSFATLHDWPAQRQFMQAQFPDACHLMPDLEADFAHHPVGTLGTIRCQHWHYRGLALLLGDAAHAIVPFHGQGMNAAFEDCTELMKGLQAFDGDWQAVFENFQQSRIANANAIADMALENYEVMRDSVRDPRFLLRKALEHELERRHPGRFIARYSLVMFHRIPYVEAQQRGAVQARLLDGLLERADDLGDVDFDEAASLVHQQLPPIESGSA